VTRTAVQVFVVLLTIEASYFLLRANLGLSPAILAELVATKLDWNVDILRTLAQQVASTGVGFTLLLLAAAIQVGNLAWEMSYEDFKFDCRGAFIALLLGGLVLPAALAIANWRERWLVDAVQRLLAEMEDAARREAASAACG
jgi:hypothetical protein